VTMEFGGIGTMTSTIVMHAYDSNCFNPVVHDFCFKMIGYRLL